MTIRVFQCTLTTITSHGVKADMNYSVDWDALKDGAAKTVSYEAAFDFSDRLL